MDIQDATADLPWGLHDARIEQFTHDILRKRVSVVVRVAMTERQDFDQRGRLILEGVEHWLIDAPHETGLPRRQGQSGLWMDVAQGRPPSCKHEWPPVQEGCFEDTWYINEWNSFIHVVAREARFEWIETEMQPSRSGSHVFFPGDEVDL